MKSRPDKGFAKELAKVSSAKLSGPSKPPKATSENSFTWSKPVAGKSTVEPRNVQRRLSENLSVAKPKSNIVAETAAHITNRRSK